MAEEKFVKEQYRHPDHNKLHLYTREKSPNWWCVFYHKGKAIRTTTKCSNKPDAEDFASDWYFNKQVEIKSGVINTSKPKNLPTVKDASNIAINKYRILVDQGKRSKEYFRGITQVMGKHILPYFGNMPIEDVDKVKWNNFKEELYTKNSKIARNSIHQYRNALSLCMNSAEDKGWIKSIPNFKIESESNKDKKGRVWFKPTEQPILLQALDDNVEHHRETPHRKGAMELRDYVKFILSSGLRTGEAKNVKFADIEITKPEGTQLPNILIRNIEGKRGTGTCNADRALFSVYKSISDRVKPTDKNQKLFQQHHREMFNVVLNKCSLKTDIDGRKRDFVSLRHTYISNKILDQMPHYEIAVNCRTSVDMIEKHYARHLQAEMLNVHKKEDKAISEEMESLTTVKGEIEALKNDMATKIMDDFVLKMNNESITDSTLLNNAYHQGERLSSIIDRDEIINEKDPELVKTELQKAKLIEQIAKTVGLTAKEAIELLKKVE